jgi:hypothetical protein
MGTLGGFPNPPALRLRRAKPGYANAIMRRPEKFDEKVDRIPEVLRLAL